MALITLPVDKVEDSLQYLIGKLRAGIQWIGAREGTITLNVPDPYEHALTRKAGYNCFTDDDDDECADIGIFLGVLRSMKSGGGKRPRAAGKTRRRK